MFRGGARTLLVGALAVAVAGCTVSATPTSTPAPSATVNSERGPVMLAVPDVNATAWTKLAATWNSTHPTEPVTIRLLSADPTVRHDQLVQDAQAKNGENTIVALDSAWIAEFAVNGWVQSLNADDFATQTMLPGPAAAGTSNRVRYGYPVTAEASVLYYRKDLLARVGAKVPKTWAELGAVCDQVRAQPETSTNCYGTGLRTSESLTENVIEAINAAGGSVLDTAGQPSLGTAEAAVGVDRLVTAVKSGTVTTDALTWDDAEAADAFAQGKLIFVRGALVNARLFEAGDGTSAVAGRVGVAGLVGPGGAAVPNAGGLQLSLSASGRNDATAADVIRWLGSDAGQRELLASGFAPVQAGLYQDAAVAKQVPTMPVFAAALTAARPLPNTAHYAEVSQLMATSLAPVVAGKEQAVTVLPDLQNRLVELLK
ncbi:MAG: extracellular solute-binding protein [Propionibacteriales bacterium]|nr:extracellular solute-binding protein [Propionibacteriales bacterium]